MLINGYIDTPMGLLPEEWDVKPIKLISKKLRAGGTPRRGNNSYYGGNTPFVKIEDITNASTYLTHTNENITEAGLEASSAWVVPKNTVLLAMYASIGKVAITSVPVATNQAIIAIIPKPEIFHEYLYYALLYHGKELIKYNVQSTQKNINKGIIENFELPIPRFSEQRAIAHVLSTVRHAIESTERVITSARELKRSMMKYLFTYGPVPVDQADQVKLIETEIGEIPKKWELKRAKDVFPRVTDGLHNTPPKLEKGIPLVTSKLLRDGKILFEKADYFISPEEHIAANARSGVSDWDIIFSMIGSLGEVVLVRPGYPNFSIKNAGLFKTGGNQVMTEYLYYWLSSEMSKKYVQGKSSGSIQKYVSLGFLRDYPIPIPPVEEISEIVKIFDSINQKINVEMSRRNVLEKLFQSLIQKLMSGKLRVPQELMKL